MSPSLASPERPLQQEPPPFGLFPIRHSQTSCTLPRHSQFGVYPTPHARPVMPDRLHNTSVIEPHGAAPTSAPQSPLPVFPPAMSRLAAVTPLVPRSPPALILPCCFQLRSCPTTPPPKLPHLDPRSSAPLSTPRLCPFLRRTCHCISPPPASRDGLRPRPFPHLLPPPRFFNGSCPFGTRSRPTTEKKKLWVFLPHAPGRRIQPLINRILAKNEVHVTLHVVASRHDAEELAQRAHTRLSPRSDDVRCRRAP